MPQLDINTYITNFLWLIIIFFVFYTLVLKVFLPSLMKNFLYRKFFVDLSIKSTYKNRNFNEFLVHRFQFIESLIVNFLSSLFVEDLDHVYVYNYSNYYLILMESYKTLYTYSDFSDIQDLDIEFLLTINDDDDNETYA
jgi:hypothetical protein